MFDKWVKMVKFNSPVYCTCTNHFFMNSVKWPCSPWVLVAQWIECPPGVHNQKVMGSIPVGDTDFFLCPMLMPCWSIHLSLPSIVIHLSLLTMTLTVLILAVCRTPVTYCIWTRLNDLALREFLSSVDRVPAWCSGGHGFNSRWGLRFFLCPMLVSCWSIHLSSSVCILGLRNTIPHMSLPCRP